MTFTIIRWKVFRPVHANSYDGEVHHVMTLRLYRTEDEAQAVADRLNKPYGHDWPWEVERTFFQMTEKEHEDYRGWLGWSQ